MRHRPILQPVRFLPGATALPRQSDCNSDEICNSSDPNTGGSCIPATACGASVHCPFNHYCSKAATDAAGTCQPGCRSTGDCQLGYVCAGGQCAAGGTSSDCTTCPATPDPDATYCDYNEICTSQGACQAVANPTSVCATCKASSYPPQNCPSANTVCLIDDEVQGAEYCAPVCTVDADCPNGYAEGGCGFPSLVLQQCSHDTDCSAGAVCMVQAESATSYCSCTSDSECAGLGGATCSASSMFFDCGNYPKCCQNSGLPCSSDAQCELGCTMVPYGAGTAGLCLTKIGVCGKDQGYTCDMLKNTTADCRQL